ncbi:MAG: hypothetical protein SFT90_07020 [Rickettsiales bacterium]|nr:hypothetical protein [Rickettsiales bacterium]
MNKLLQKIFKLKKPILKDAEEVLSAISDVVFNSSLDIYRHIYTLPNSDKTGYEEENITRMKNVRESIRLIIKYEGDVNSFSEEEKEIYLPLMQEGAIYYDDLVRVLVEHHDDISEANHLFEIHPELHNYIPKQYDNSRQVIEVLIEYIRNYQWLLERFVNKYFSESEAN